MSKDKRKYLSAYVPEVKPKETPKRSGIKSDGRTKEIEDAIAAFNELLATQNRDNLDAMYNIDLGNMSSSMRRLFQSYDDGITKANASIESWANAQEAGFKAIAEWIGTDEDGNLISSAAAIKGTADANHASIEALAKLVDEDSKALAGFKSEVSKTYATTAQFSSFQTTVNNTITNSYAGFVTQANATYAKTAQIASVTDENGNVTAASIAAEIKDDTSLINLIAESINLEGYVTVSSLEGNGTATINGNNISLVLDGDADDGWTNIESQSSLNFVYSHYYSGEWIDSNFARIYTSVDGSDTNEASRYALNIYANRFHNDKNKEVFASLKLEAAGRMSLRGQFGIYMSTDYNGYITLDTSSGNNTRIVAAKKHTDAVSSVSEASNTYHFATDGIYFNGVKYAGGGASVAVFG